MKKPLKVIGAIIAASEGHTSDAEFLVWRMMHRGEWECRKQLRDIVLAQRKIEDPAIIAEVSCWGVDDAKSAYSEIRALA